MNCNCRHCYKLAYTSSREAHKFDGLYKRLGKELGAAPADVKRALETLKQKGTFRTMASFGKKR